MNRLSRRRARAILLGILLLGGIFRFQGLDWDEGHHLHPDERFISMVEEKLEFPKGAGSYFDSRRSTLNPYNRGESSFVYGTLPLVMAKAVAPLFGKKGYGGTHLVGRGLSGLFDLFTVWLVYRITRRFTYRRGALFAAGLSAFCVLGIQLSHFWAVDAFLATFTAAALLGAVRIAQNRSGWAGDAATGVAIGLAAACKITALALFAPAGVALLVRALARRRASGRTIASLLAEIPRGAALLVAAAATVRIFLPHVFLGPSPLSFRLDPRWVDDLRRLKALSSSVAGFPPALQWAGRSLFFPIENFVLWGAGLAFGFAAIAALVWSVVAILRRRPRALELAPLALYVLFLFLYHGLTLVKSIRYLYPAYPALAALTGIAFSSWLARSRVPRLARLCALGVLAFTFLWAVAFTSIYRRPNTRVEASRWIYAHVPPPKAFGNESWDDGQPMPMPGYDPARYAGPSLPLFDPDSPEKVDAVVRALTEADWIAVTSGRVYMNVTRVPSVFPMSIAYYRALFDGRLGFARAADFTSYPSLGPLRFPDDRAEEQFTVYDHPRVLLFRKTPDFSPAKARALLMAAIPETPPTMNEWERWPRALRRVSAPVRPELRSEPEAKGWTEPSRAHSVVAAIVWYLAIALVGALALPLAFAAFPRFADRGFGFARILGLVLVTYVLTLGLTLRLFANGRRAAVVCLALLAVASAVSFFRNRHDLRRFLHDNRRSLLQSEAVFAVGFLLFLGIRALNPEIYWGEKPMDFSLLNILVRTRALPPSDPWLAGYPLGYYTFGQEMVVFLTLLTNLSTRFTFNLAFGLLGGTILQGAFALARNWGGQLRTGVAGAALTLLLGNLSGLREWLLHKKPLDWDYFWATSRVIRDTINEYPFWSLVFADLHAHVLAIPVFLLFAAAALNLVRLHAVPDGWPRRLGAAVLLGFVAACQALTNAWDVPLLAGLVLLVIPISVSFMPRLSLASLARAGAALVVVGGSAYAFALPLWFRAGGRPGIGRNLEPSSLGVDQLTVFGFFFVLALGWWISSVTGRFADRGVGRPARWIFGLLLATALAFLAVRYPDAFLLAAVLLFVGAFFFLAEEKEDRLTLGFLATAFFLVLFAQRLYIVDRMNTFFKLYLEAWLLFAIGCAVLVFRSKERRGAIDRWTPPGKVAVALVAVAALFTSVTAGRAAVSRHFAPYSGPSLDGLRYLETQRPGEYRAVEWLRHNVAGTPVILEAQGPSYQDFGRISMLTGLPTVLGWDYHVKQRGNPESEIQTRKTHVRSMYAQTEAAPALALMKRYRVGYVYVGPLEKTTYPAAGLRKFRENPDMFALAYENPEVQIYRVAGGPAQDVILPVKETLPQESAGAGPPADEPEEAPSVSAKPSGEPEWGNLREPRGIAVDAKGRVWIADFGNSRLRVFDRDGGYLGGWGGRGSGEFGFRELCGVAIRGDALYVADTWNGRVRGYTLDGLLRGSAADLYGPRGVAVAPDGRVWVSDTGNHRVLSYDPLLGDRRIVGKKGSGPGELMSPMGIAVSPKGEVFVADTGNKRIQVFAADGSLARILPFPGWGENVEPGLAIDFDGTIWASDPGSGSVVSLDPTGRLLSRRATDENNRRLENPTGIAIDVKDRILYVVNSGSSTVSKIRLAPGAGPAVAPTGGKKR